MNRGSSEILFFFTAEYPYGAAETFIETELIVLSKNFSSVYILPLVASGIARQMPRGCEVLQWNKTPYNPRTIFFKKSRRFFLILFRELFSTPLRFQNFKSFSEVKSILLQNFYRAECINECIQKHKMSTCFFYTFWFEDWAIALGILKETKKIKSYVSRVHGYDLYRERRENKRIPFRNFQMETVEKIYAVSKDGVNYLMNEFPKHRNKIKLSHLGINDKGANPFEKSDVLTLVSCSNLILLKRVHVLVEILKKTSVPIHWVHFGDGPLKDQISKSISDLPENVSVELRGLTKNSEIIKFYQIHPVQLMIHLSESEGGVPVALQEAASFGIPLLASDIGGVPEIVTEQTGILIPAQFNVNAVARLLNNFIGSDLNTQKFREGCKEFWKQSFNAESNYQRFCEELKRL